MMYQEQALFSKTWNRRTSRVALIRSVIIAFSKVAEPSATFWTTHHTYLRQHGLPLVLAEWSTLTGLDSSFFPWTEDEVGTTWEEWRKTNAQYRAEYLRQVGLELEG